jgi:membrane protease YdiL (CAAX protease family)
MSIQLKKTLTLFLLALAGIFTLLLLPFNTDQLPEEVLQQISAETLRYLSLLNPLMMVIAAVLAGHFCTPKSGLDASLLQAIYSKGDASSVLKEQLKFGVPVGVLVGLVFIAVGLLYEPLLPKSFLEASKETHMPALTRFLYGGITEEVILRWGFMSFIAWFFLKFSSAKNLTSWMVWLAIILAALLFGILHLPAASQLAGGLTFSLTFYIVFMNAFFGIFGGWLYWKKGLESAIIAHISVHIIIILANLIIKAV